MKFDLFKVLFAITTFTIVAHYCLVLIDLPNQARQQAEEINRQERLIRAVERLSIRKEVEDEFRQ